MPLSQALTYPFVKISYLVVSLLVLRALFQQNVATAITNDMMRTEATTDAVIVPVTLVRPIRRTFQMLYMYITLKTTEPRTASIVANCFIQPHGSLQNVQKTTNHLVWVQEIPLL